MYILIFIISYDINYYRLNWEIRSTFFICKAPILYVFKEHTYSTIYSWWKSGKNGTNRFVVQTNSAGYLRGGFKTQPPVDRRFHPVPPGFYCSKQCQPPGTGRNRRSTGGCVLKPPLRYKEKWQIFNQYQITCSLTCQNHENNYDFSWYSYFRQSILL